MKHSILLVDDEGDYIEAMAERLKLRGFVPTCATGGTQGIALADENEPDAMILDLRMPDMDGVEVLRHMRTHHPNIKVIILTGHGTEADRVLCSDLGAVAFYNKPINIKVLVKTLHDALESA